MPLNIDWQQILLHLLNFAILAFGLYLLLYHPIKKFMKKREESYREREDKANQTLESAREKSEEYARKLADADREIAEKRKEIESAFVIAGDSAADKRVKKPTDAQMNWSAKVACAQERMVKEYGLDALAYYYHGSEGTEYQDIQSGFIVGHSLLTAKHVPCAGEADIKTCVAMKICDLLSLGGSYCEIVTTDYDLGTIIVGHDGPFHIAIANGKPVLRGMGVYHGKQGTGISVEAKVKTGAVTTLGIAQGANGTLKMIVAEGESTDAEIMQIGNTQTHVRFSSEPDAFMERWFKEAPTHHFALSLGHNAPLFQKIAKLLGAECVVL